MHIYTYLYLSSHQYPFLSHYCPIAYILPNGEPSTAGEKIVKWTDLVSCSMPTYANYIWMCLRPKAHAVPPNGAQVQLVRNRINTKEEMPNTRPCTVRGKRKVPAKKEKRTPDTGGEGFPFPRRRTVRLCLRDGDWKMTSFPLKSGWFSRSVDLEVSEKMAVTPSHHPFIAGIFPSRPSILGYPHDYGNTKNYIYTQFVHTIFR